MFGTHTVIFGFLAILSSVFFCAPSAEAQFLNGNEAARIVLTPAFPGPHTEVTAALDAYTVNTSGATITWSIDGTILPQFQNERSITFTTGDYGTTTKVAVVVKRDGRTLLNLLRTIEPIAIDLIVEADTFVPSFYKGRALPSAGAPVRIIALPFTSTEGKPENFTYQWELGTTVLFGGPIRGKMVADILVPDYGDDYVTVTVTDERGYTIGTRSIRIALTEPELHFYEENPLRGLYPLAIKDTLSLIGAETTVYGMPYFMAEAKNATKKTAYTWTIDNSDTVSGNTDPKSITLRREQGSGTARVELSVLTGSTIPQYFSSAFTVHF